MYAVYIVKIAPNEVIADRFRLDALIGRGGMGTVWSATHLVTSARVALKVLEAPAGMRAERRARFLAEARAASAIAHPNVIRVHDLFDLDATTSVMVLDLLEGESLAARLARDERLTLRDTHAILLPVIEAVRVAHARGIVHRDLKPDNVFLVKQEGGGETPMVLDFGIAKWVGGAQEGGVVTVTGSMLGTAGYMSPEQGFGEKEIDGRADIWALGVMLYECLAGMRPIEGDNLGQYLKRVMTDAITPLEVLSPELPAELTRVVARMLAVDRDERLTDLAEVTRALEGREPSPPARPAAPLTDSVEPRSPPSTPASSRTRLAARVVPWLALTGLVSGAIALASGGSGRETSEVPLPTTVAASAPQRTSPVEERSASITTDVSSLSSARIDSRSAVARAPGRPRPTASVPASAPAPPARSAPEPATGLVESPPF